MHPTETSFRYTPNYYVSEHFMYSDFVCPCCDRLKIVPGFYRHIELLEELRYSVGFAIIVNSGYRCTDHNRAVGGAEHSWHLLFATDIRPSDGNPDNLRLLYRMALTSDFGGIGLYDTFLHLDLRPEKVRWRG